MFAQLAERLKALRGALTERDPGQSFMDVPFELRVTSGGSNGLTCVCPKCGYTESRGDRGCGTRGCPRCGRKRLENFVEDLQFERAASSSSMKVQSLIFDKDTFSKAQAIKWAKSHGFKADKVDEKANTWRIRQRDPGEFELFRTIRFKPGLQATVARG